MLHGKYVLSAEFFNLRWPERSITATADSG